MSSIEEINTAMQSLNDSKSRAILRDAKSKGYITEGNKWSIKGLRALSDLSDTNAQSQQDHKQESKESAALKYIQSLAGR